jgi:hypothetical protein
MECTQRVFGSRNSWKIWGCLALAAGMLTASCDSQTAKAPNPNKPIAERRAQEVIARGIRSQNEEAMAGRKVKTTTGAELTIDVAVKGHQFGVAYLTANDLAAKDADKLPKKDPQRPGALLIAEAEGEKEKGTKIVILFDKDYMYDDHLGEEHEQTNITAEAKLERDTRDFVVLAKSQRWP